MIFFRGPLIRAGSPRETLFRVIGMLLVFSLVAWSFWFNSKRNMERIERQGTVADMVQGLNDEDRKLIRKYRQSFKDEYGLELRVLVTEGDLSVSGLDGKTIFIAVNPQEKTTVLEIPILARRTLGEEVVQRIRDESLQKSVDSGNWQAGILVTLDTLWQELARASGAHT